MIDTQVRHYRILEHLGGGAMGLVYRAEDTHDGSVVALKFLPYELKEDPEARERFLREAQAASALDHPNICGVCEIGEADDGRMFVALDFHEGETLKKKLERGPLQLTEALDITRQLAQGLAEAHTHGIVHRDLVPANVLVTNGGGVKILDFGLAKMVSGGGLTQIGWSLGTPEYMAPEQIRGDDSDRRIDLWTLGTLLYEMTSGRQPFEGGNLAHVLLAIQSRDPEPLQQVAPGVPPGLSAIVGRLLSKDPEARYASGEELLADLDSLNDADTPAATEGSAGWSLPGPPLLWIALALLLLLLLAFLLAGGSADAALLLAAARQKPLGIGPHRRSALPPLGPPAAPAWAIDRSGREPAS